MSDLKDHYLRLQEEFDRYRERTKGEAQRAYERGVFETVSDLVSLVDLCDRAISTVAEHEEVAEGIRKLRDDALARFERLGMTSFGCPGDLFDPQLHYAWSVVPHGSRRIVDVHERGWTDQNGNIIKVAKVTIGSGYCEHGVADCEGSCPACSLQRMGETL